jgi:hypothetical protein
MKLEAQIKELNAGENEATGRGPACAQ